MCMKQEGQIMKHTEETLKKQYKSAGLVYQYQLLNDTWKKKMVYNSN